MTDILHNPWLLSLIVALGLALLVDRWERWRLARPGGPYAAADFSGVILLAALGVATWQAPAHLELLRYLLVAGAVVFLIASLTDQWRPVRGLRLAGAALAGWWLCQHGLGISSVAIPFRHTFVSLGWWGPLLTVLWLALSASLFARAATINRVSLGVGAMTAATLYAICLLQPQVTGEVTPRLTLMLCGACLGLLVFPRYLAHGGATAGGYLLGFLIGAASVMGALKHTAFLVAILPLMVIGVPLFASVYAWVADYARGRRHGFWDSRHPHVHETLLSQGYSEKQVAFILLAGTAVLCALALLLVALIELTFVVKLLLLVAVLPVTLVGLYVLLRLMKPAQPPTYPADEINLLGVRVDRVTMDQALQRIEQFMVEDTPHMIVTSDAIGLMKAYDDPEFRDLVNGADLVTADGMGVVLSARLLNMPLSARVSGCDLVGEISKVAARLGRSVYLLGAAPGVADKAAEKLCEMAPGLVIAGCRDGYFKPEDEPGIIADITAKHPAALFVALGNPRQERWIKTHMQELGVPVCIGIGGSFDVISGLKQRAPVWMQRCGLEWLYRTCKEPSRLPRLWALPRIVLMSLGQLLRPPREGQ